MSMVAPSPSAVVLNGISGTYPRSKAPTDVVEIGLLVPADWAAALVKMSESRQQTVAQMLRSMIERALFANGQPG
jgi:hypothetical protein